MQLTIERPLGFYKISDDVLDPIVATSSSACFDLHAYIPWKTEVKRYNKENEKETITSLNVDNGKIVIRPGDRVLVPTGLIFDIPAQCSVRLHARSGLSLKQGLVLANSEGVIDEDYVDPVYAMITNISNVDVAVFNGDRICQAELVYQPNFALFSLQTSPAQKTDRDGGFGSTGV
jgi:dUTP pyrophosphatase